jgi:hypothetical protein
MGVCVIPVTTLVPAIRRREWPVTRINFATGKFLR